MTASALKGVYADGECFMLRCDDRGRRIFVTGENWADCGRKYYTERRKMVRLEKMLDGIRMIQDTPRRVQDRIGRLESFMAEHPDFIILTNAKTHEAAVKDGLELPKERVMLSEHVEGDRIYIVDKKMAAPRMETL